MKTEKKIVSWQQMREIVRAWQDNGEEIVFTNGCFDILHIGHITYLEGAKSLGDKLIIGLNSDASTKKLKGETRPINREKSRAYLLASLSCVDLVTIFEQDTPEELIAEVHPDILVKGGDYTEEQVAGGTMVKEWGGRVVILPYKEGYSTTNIEQKILSMQNAKEKKA